MSKPRRITPRMKARLAMKMRLNPTKGEARLWEVLKDRWGDVEWETQVVLFGWIADFYAEEISLVVEVDGSSHVGREDYDAFRDKTLWETYGVTTIRLTNVEVLKNRPRALRKILDTVANLEDGT